MQRLSVSLDDKSVVIIEKFLQKYNSSQADIIRKGLNCLETMEKATEKTTLESILIYVDYLAEREHLIIDIAHWKAIFIEINNGSTKFWDEVYKIGNFHNKEYADKGIKNIEQILKYVEKTNWYQLKQDSTKSYTLILAVSESSKFIKTFFEGFFSNYPQKVNITEENMKLRINID